MSVFDLFEIPPSNPDTSSYPTDQNVISVPQAVKRGKIYSYIPKNDEIPFSVIPYYFDPADSLPVTKFIPNWTPYNYFIPPTPDPESRRYDPSEISKKTTSIEPFISIQDVVCINPSPGNRFEQLIINYGLGNISLSTIISYNNFMNHKLLDLFNGVRSRTNSKKLANDFLFELICSVEWLFAAIPNYPGWYLFRFQLNDSCYQEWKFVSSGTLTILPNEIRPEPVMRQKLFFSQHSNETIIQHYLSIMPDDKAVKLLSGFRIASQLLGLFEFGGVKLDHMLAVEVLDTITADYVIALLQTREVSLHSVPLNANRMVTTNALRTTNDGVVVFRDTDFSGDKKRSETAISCIQNDLYCVEMYQPGYRSRHLLGVISPSAFEWFSGDKVLSLSFSDLEKKFQCSADVVVETCREFDTMFLRFIELNLDAQNLICSGKEKGSLRAVPLHRQNVYNVLMYVYRLVNNLINNHYYSNEDAEYLKAFLKDENYTDFSTRICSDFMETLNECLRSGTIPVVDRKVSKIYQTDTYSAIAMDAILGLEPSTIENIILPKMHRSVEISRLVKALEHGDMLYSPEKKHHNLRHTIIMNDDDGERIEVHVYSVYRNFLDADVRMLIDNLGTNDYLFDVSDNCPEDFLPMIRCNERFAGTMLRYEDEEDHHLYVSGQTSSGKTYALAQRAAFLWSLNHRVIIFDAEGTLDRTRLSGKLPNDFIEKRIEYYDLEDEGIPVNLLHLERKNGNTDKAILEGLLTAGCSKLTGSQTDALRKAISKLLLENVPTGDVTLNDIRNILNDPDVLNEGVRRRIEPILDDLSAFDMSNNSWDEFFKDRRKIIIFSMKPAFRKRGIRLFDILLASLYNYQVHNDDHFIDIIFDEVQKQNLSDTGSLWKIVTEGRKFHMALICATQEYVTARNSSLGALMGKFHNKLFMAPTSDSETAVAAALGYNAKKKRMFDAMQRGDSIVKVNLYSKSKHKNIYATVSGQILSYEEWQKSHQKDA